MVNAYFLESKEPVSLEQLASFGVTYNYLDPQNYDEDLKKIEDEKGYGHRSEVCCSRKGFGDNYEAMMTKFFEEHLHEYPEIRFIMEGSGFFDVRDKKDEWIRVEVTGGDLIVLPAGMYHRFNLDEKEHLKAMRLFVKELKEPIWTPCNRNLVETDDLPSRISYLSSIKN